jgi:hypothetical protein
VAESLVVGIFPSSDAKALESALAAQQVDLSKVKVVGGSIQDTANSQLEFIDVITDMESNSLSDDMTKGSGVWDETGTDVPGIGGRQATLGQFRHRDATPSTVFADFPIPSDEVDNFSDAVAGGRAVVLYSGAGADAATVAAAFRAAGLRNVRSY